MTFLPIVARELRIAARRSGTHWVRSGGALAILVIGAWFFLMYPDSPKQYIAKGLFGILTGSAVLFCLFSGVWFTADSLSEEKREGTLGLLFLTDLKGYDVVFGKLVATSFNAFYAVVAVVPILAVPLLLGGVTPGEFGRMALLVVNTLFFSLSLGMCVSATCHSPRKAMMLTLAAILFFTAILPMLGAWGWMFGRTPNVARQCLMASVGFAYYGAFDQAYTVRPDDFWWSVGIMHGLAWVFLVLASVITPRSWQDRPDDARGAVWRNRWHSWRYGDPAERVALRAPLLDQSAYCWLASRSRLAPAYVWAVLGIIACGWTWGLAHSHRDWLNEATYVLTGLLLNFLLKVWVGLEAGRQIAEDRKQGTLELLLSTPLTIRDILRGQLLALQRQFLGPLALVLAVFFGFAMTASSDAALMEGPAERRSWIMLWAAAMVMLAADCVALYWVGMWRALTARSPIRAAAGSLVRILVLPWLGLALLALVASFGVPRFQAVEGDHFFLGAWVVVGAAVDLAFGLWARHKLLTEFRLAATRRYAPRGSLRGRTSVGP